MLRVLVSGASDAPPVVLLHGQPGSPHEFDPLVAALPDHRTYAVERPGWGTSTLPAGGFRTNARTVADWLAVHDPRPAVVVGHSWGAGVALELGLSHRHLVRGLVLVGPVGAREAVTPADRALALLGPRVVRLALSSVAATFRHDRLRPWEMGAVPVDRRPAVATFWASRGTARAFVTEQRAFVRTAGALADRLPGLDVPTVVVSGERDRVVTPAHARALALALPHARLVSTPGGHLTHLDDPDVVAAAVRSLG